MKTYFVYSVKIIWLSLSVLILCFSLHRLSQLHSMHDISELISVMAYGMVLISFPTGMASAVLLFLVDFIIGVNIGNKYVVLTVIWFVFLLGGYIQWFLLMSKIIRKWEYKKWGIQCSARRSCIEDEIMTIINRNLLLLISSLFVINIYSYNSFAYEKNLSLSSVASFPSTINALK